jgi:general secretion pathway protein F
MTTVFAPLAARPLTLEQLAALSDEMAALARAGVPLDRGLRELAHDMPGKLGDVAGAIGTRLEKGHSLEQIVADLETTLPPAYRSVIVAGLRAGRLPAALESIAGAARRIGQLRSSIGLSLIYPVIVLGLAWSLGLFVLVKIAPVMARMLVEFEVTTLPLEQVVADVIRTAPWWGPLVPLLLGVWLATVWYRSGRIAGGIELRPWLSMGAVGTLARLQRASRLASLTELLALLVEQEVPLAEAIELSSAAVGSSGLSRAGKELAEQLRRGEPIDLPPPGFPPLLAWTLAHGQSQAALCQTLARTAQVYRDEVNRRSQWLALYVPLVLTILICGGVALIYAVLTLGPWLAIMHRIAQPF